MADLELEFEDDEEEEEGEEEEEERPRRYRRSESLFSVTKEDLIIVMLVAFGGIFVGWYANKLLNKKEHHAPFPYSFPMHYPAAIHHEEREESTPGTSTTIAEKIPDPRHKMNKKRGGYHLDRHGNAMLESPAVQENWIIKRGFDGTIIDAYKIDESIR